jgi:nucleoprotein TPR
MARLDQREIRRATADNDDINTGETLDQATETIEKLHKQLLEANKKINESTRERDFFSKLLARGEGLKWSAGASGNGPMDDGPGPHQETIEMLRSEIEGVRVKAEEELRGVKVSLREKEAAIGEAEIAKARAEAKASMLEGTFNRLVDGGGCS